MQSIFPSHIDSLHPSFIFILWYLEKLCVNVISWKKCFYTKCRVANIGRSIIPGHESGMERRREDHHLQSSHFFIQSQEKRVDSGQWTLTGDWRLADQEINWVFCCETSQTQTFASAFSQDQTFFHSLCYWEKITVLTVILSRNTVLFGNGAISMITS